LKVTCHRAFDMTRDPFEALEDCIEVGFTRILTSGRQPQALAGADLIAQLIERAKGRIAIMPGSGVNENTVREIVHKTNCREIHFSATAFREGGMQYKNELIAGMGSSQGSEYQLRTVDVERVRKMRELANHHRFT
ncbi:MAG: copper homeostasis protein CutC, partial [Flammeovirgaceae bacterium]